MTVFSVLCTLVLSLQLVIMKFAARFNQTVRISSSSFPCYISSLWSNTNHRRFFVGSRYTGLFSTGLEQRFLLILRLQRTTLIVPIITVMVTLLARSAWILRLRLPWTGDNQAPERLRKQHRNPHQLRGQRQRISYRIQRSAPRSGNRGRHHRRRRPLSCCIRRHRQPYPRHTPSGRCQEKTRHHAPGS